MPEAAAELAGLTLHSRGKVREMYDLGDRLLMVASDRISAYDVVLPTPIPDKGKVLTGLSVFWFERTADIVPNHLLSAPTCPTRRAAARWSSRSSRSSPSSAWCAATCRARAGRNTAARPVCGIALPPGLRESDRLPEPIFTPATKAEIGDHDENVDFDRAAEIVGDRGADGGAAPALARGLLARGRARRAQRHHPRRHEVRVRPRRRTATIVLADEVLTPDSSRFWPATYEPGGGQPSFDKQYVRDWLDESGWDHSPPGPELPAEVVEGTRAKYVEAYERIAGEPFERWLER